MHGTKTLYDIDADAVVANSTVTTGSNTLTRVRSVALTLTDGHEYRVRYGNLNTDEGKYVSGKIVVV